MWPLLKKKKNANTNIGRPVSSRPRPMKFAQLVEGMGDFNDLREHDIALKFWLPEPAVEALKEIADRGGDSLSTALRQFFAHHCYGIYAFQVMCDAIPSLFKDFEPAKFSRPVSKASSADESDDARQLPDVPQKKRVDTYWVPELGKNVVAIKVWIPSRLRND